MLHRLTVPTAASVVAATATRPTREPNVSVDEFELRPARPSDAQRIAEIWHVGWRDGHLGHVPGELIAERDRDSFDARAQRRLGDTTVAVIDGDIAGFVMVVDDEVEQIYVASAYRGSGVADVLMTEAERRIESAGHAAAWLAVVASNERARRFYSRRGWSDHGVFDYPAATKDGSIPVPAHRYVKQLRTHR